MREKVNEIQISIPEELGARVGAALGEVRRLHRKRVLRRAGAVMGSFVAVVGVMLGMAAVNPAMASQIPLVGGLAGQPVLPGQLRQQGGSRGSFCGDLWSHGGRECVRRQRRVAGDLWRGLHGRHLSGGVYGADRPPGTAGAVPLCLGRSRGPDCRRQRRDRPGGGRQRLCGAGRQMDLHHDGAGA